MEKCEYEELKSIGNRIRYLRTKELKMSQKELAKLLGMSHTNLSSIEKDQTNLRKNNLDKLCDTVLANPDWILYGKEPIFIDKYPFAEEFRNFGYLMENGSLSKKATLTMVLKLLTVVPDEQWDLLMDPVLEILEEQKEKRKKKD